MQFKAILTVSLLSAAQVAYAAPPPCLMAAVNTQPNPSDFKSICGDNASMVQKQIESVCKGDDLTAALASFADTCRTNGVAVPPVAPSSSTTSGTSSSSSSGSGSASGTDIPTYTTTGASSGSVPVPVPGTDTATATPDPYTSAYNLTSLLAGTSHGSTSATSTGKNGTHTTGTGTGTGTGSVGTSVPAATGGGTKTSGTSGSAAGSAKPSTTSGVAGRLAGSIGGLVMVAAGAIFML
ncbi:hypothetical protein Vi05172_g4692 [Venturia inaequalis]|nr:hypothetical protein Vi05172_g4692 [Venturia inaequalis]